MELYAIANVSDTCLICGEMFYSDEAVVVTKGMKTLNEASRIRKDDLFMKLEGCDEVTLHMKCLKDYTRKS